MRHRYSRWLVGSLLLILAAIAIFNWAVDPLDVYHPPWSKSLAAYKMHAIDRIPKAEAACRQPFAAVLIGDSRVLRAFDPRHPALTAFGAAYNLGVSASSIFEATRMLELCSQQHPPKVVIWSLAPELVDGDRRQRTSFDYELSRLNPNLNPILYHAHTLWGRDVLKASVDVLKRARRQQPTHIVDGFAPDRHRDSDPHGLFRRWLPVAPDTASLTHRPGDSSQSTRRQISRSLEDMQQRGTRVIVLFPPVHAAYLAGLSQIGQWEAYENGKRQIVGLAERCNTSAEGQPPITVWDFSAFDGFAAEPPPVANQTEPMRWYLDPLHFRETLGDIVLDRILTEADAPAEFGVVLTTDNVEAHLAALRTNRQRYCDSSREVLQMVSEQAMTIR